MSIKFCYFIVVTSILLGCSERGNKKDSTDLITGVNDNVDLKWHFYAHTFNGKVLFIKDSTPFIFSPVECEVVITDSMLIKDTVIYNMKFAKDNFEFQNVYDVLPVYGFKVISDIKIPLTGMIYIKSFNDTGFIKLYNQRADSAFIQFLKTSEREKLSHSLLKEAIKRKAI